MIDHLLLIQQLVEAFGLLKAGLFWRYQVNWTSYFIKNFENIFSICFYVNQAANILDIWLLSKLSLNTFNFIFGRFNVTFNAFNPIVNLASGAAIRKLIGVLHLEAKLALRLLHRLFLLFFHLHLAPHSIYLHLQLFSFLVHLIHDFGLNFQK